MRWFVENESGKIFVSEKGKLSPEDMDYLEKNSTEYEEGGNTAKIMDSDLIVYSPAVRPDTPILEEARKKGIETIGELEFAWRHVLKDSKVVAITGSNGKTTTTSLVDHILSIAGINHFTGGNIGTAATDCRGESIAVLEVSSFQLMGTENFYPHIGAILNISPNHLDWHRDMKEYITSKLKLSDSELFIYNVDSEFIPEAYGVTVSNDFGDVIVEREGFWIEGGFFDISETKLRGMHNSYNAAFASTVCKLLGVDDEKIHTGLESFVPLEHRQERFAEIDGITYVNDSKSTTSESTLAALENFEKAILIVGGRPKEKDYSRLANEISQKTKFVILMGEMAPVIEGLLGSFPHAVADSLEESIGIARKIAKKGDVILLSPAATSFDMFKSYEERGKKFKRIVLDGKIGS